MSILAYNGAAIMAMKGKECVAIAADRRFGVQAQTISTEFDKIFEMGPNLYLGLPGLATDVQTVICESPALDVQKQSGTVSMAECLRISSRTYTINFAMTVTLQRLKFRLNMYELRENRRIKPKTFMNMVSNLLYERRFGPYFVEPIIAGLDPRTSEPYIASMDLIGCPMETNDFVVSGTCSEQMYGMCESLWEPNLEPDDLFETISQALMNAFDRDALSGWGAVVYIIEKDKVTVKHLKTRQD